jgi:transketolase
LSEKLPTPLKRIGVTDHFGEVGFTDFLKEKYNLTSKDIVKAAKEVITGKHKA